MADRQATGIKAPLAVYVGDVVQMRKPHPCGGDTWRVVRVGAEIGIRCLTCERKVFLRRSDLARRIKAFVQRGQPLADEPPGSSEPPGSLELPGG